ncbi:hypothetical protein D3C87_1172550 [compost metagenome]
MNRLYLEYISEMETLAAYSHHGHQDPCKISPNVRSHAFLNLAAQKPVAPLGRTM